MKRIIAIAAFALIPALGACESPTGPIFEEDERGCSFMSVCPELGNPFAGAWQGDNPTDVVSERGANHGSTRPTFS
ncbi:MAG: hypothetical protein PVH96_12940 [Gemmatimonadota bacterium]